jgi:hypothetical protein
LSIVFLLSENREAKPLATILNKRSNKRTAYPTSDWGKERKTKRKGGKRKGVTREQLTQPAIGEKKEKQKEKGARGGSKRTLQGILPTQN